MRLSFAGSRGHAWLRAFAPRGWRDLLLQVALLGSFQLVYALTGIYGREKTEAAVTNGRGIQRLEQTLGIAWEHGIQTSVLRAPHIFVQVANQTYFLCQFTVSTLFLIWVYVRHTERFDHLRNALLAANYVSIAVLFLFPAAPPRLLPGAGFVDTLNADTVNLHTKLISTLNNPYSTMPSLHAAYAIAIGITGATITRSWWAKTLWSLYPCLVIYSVIATGNHFFLDVAAGAAALLATPLIGGAASLAVVFRERWGLALSWQLAAITTLAICLFSIGEATRIT